jgi:hypothetical protein
MATKSMKLGAFRKREEESDLRRRDRATAGVDPVSAAALLGMTRQAVHKAIAAGHLDAYRIVAEDDPKKTLFIVVTYASIEAYRFVRRRRPRKGPVRSALAIRRVESKLRDAAASQMDLVEEIERKR